MIVMPHYKYFVTNNKMLLLPLLYPLQLIVMPHYKYFVTATITPITNTFVTNNKSIVTATITTDYQ